MNDFIKYNENALTVSYYKATGTAIISTKNYIVQPIQQTDSIAQQIDTITQLSQKENLNSPSPGNTNTDLYKELNNNNLNLPIYERNELNNDWVTIVLLIAFVLLVSVRAGF